MPNLMNKLLNCKHPNSRKTIAITKNIKKKANREKSKLGHILKQNLIGEKLLWFQERLLDGVTCYNPDQTEEIINRYLARFDEELEQIKLKHSIGQRKNRQHASREDIINMTIKREKEEFETCGLEMPDLMNPKQLDMLQKWNGELRFIENFKLRRFSKKHLQFEREKLNKPARTGINKSENQKSVTTEEKMATLNKNEEPEMPTNETIESAMDMN